MQPENTIESIKIAAQWTFLVDQSKSVSLALGYINEFLFIHLIILERKDWLRVTCSIHFMLVLKGGEITFIP